jgi:hypothetical protein
MVGKKTHPIRQFTRGNYEVIPVANTRSRSRSIRRSSTPVIDLGVVAECFGMEESEVVRVVVASGVEVGDPAQFIGMLCGLWDAKRESEEREYVTFEYGVN